MPAFLSKSYAFFISSGDISPSLFVSKSLYDLGNTQYLLFVLNKLSIKITNEAVIIRDAITSLVAIKETVNIRSLRISLDDNIFLTEDIYY